MRIGIIGAGKMAETLGGRWARAGHDIMIGARSAQRAAAAAAAIGGGARSGGIRAAAEFGTATLLAVPTSALADVLGVAGAAAGVFDGRTLIDCTNAFAPDESATPTMRLSEEAVAERISTIAVGAQVVKAFNLCAAEVWAADHNVFDGVRLIVPLCGDDPAALATVETLTGDLDLTPVRAGGLRAARYLEAMTAFVVGLWFAGHDARAVLPPLAAAFAEPD